MRLREDGNVAVRERIEVLIGKIKNTGNWLSKDNVESMIFPIATYVDATQTIESKDS